MVLEAGESKIRGPADSVSGEKPLPGSETGSSCCVLPWWRGQGSSLGSPLKGHSFQSIAKALHPNTIALGTRFSTYEFGEGPKHSVCSRSQDMVIGEGLLCSLRGAQGQERARSLDVLGLFSFLI